MQELPFLIPAVCNRLNAHFGFEDKNLDAKNPFIKENAPLFKRYLSTSQVERCLLEFKK